MSKGLASATVYSPHDAHRLRVAGYLHIAVDNALNAGEWYHESEPHDVRRVRGKSLTLLNGRSA